MEKEFQYAFFILLALLVTQSSLGAVTTGKGKIRTLMNAYGGWLVTIEADNNNPLNCTKTNFLLEPSHGQYKELTSFILTAYTTGKPVIFYLSSCDENGYSIITGIYSSWGIE